MKKGEQRKMRAQPIIEPLMGPKRMTAFSKYAEHEGVYLHLPGPSIGEMQYLYI